MRAVGSTLFGLVALAGVLTGCESRPSPPAKSPLEFETTQEIAPASPTAPAAGAAPAAAAFQVQAFEQASQIIVDKAIAQFHALEGRYPADHQEFMEKVIKENEIRLPELPPDKEYQYDAGAHELKVVNKK